MQNLKKKVFIKFGQIKSNFFMQEKGRKDFCLFLLWFLLSFNNSLIVIRDLCKKFHKDSVSFRLMTHVRSSHNRFLTSYRPITRKYIALKTRLWHFPFDIRLQISHPQSQYNLDSTTFSLSTFRQIRNISKIDLIRLKHETFTSFWSWREIFD